MISKLFGLDSHDSICADLAAATGMELIAVDYRFAPEHRHPAAFDSSVAPTTTGAATLSTAGLATIDDLFGVDVGAGGIVVTDTLPVELL